MDELVYHFCFFLCTLTIYSKVVENQPCVADTMFSSHKFTPSLGQSWPIRLAHSTLETDTTVKNVKKKRIDSLKGRMNRDIALMFVICEQNHIQLAIYRKINRYISKSHLLWFVTGTEWNGRSYTLIDHCVFSAK